MNIDVTNKMDIVRDGTIETAEFAHQKTHEFHNNYVSKVVPDFGKYGDAAKFAAEMVPGVAEYNAINEGDWKGFAVAAGIDTGAIVLGAFSGGMGYAAIKGGSVAARAGVKVAAKEVAKTSAKKAVKETTETSVKKTVKEVAEESVERETKDVTEVGIEKTTREVTETGTKEVEKKTLEVGEKIDKTKFPEYLDEIERITKRDIPPNQKEILEKELKENDYVKLSKEGKEMAKKEFASNKEMLIKEWEKQTGDTWPRYTEDVVNKAEAVIRQKGTRYDAHHIIELSTSGPNEWWNIHPARFPSEHQNGIHAAENLARNIFK